MTAGWVPLLLTKRSQSPTYARFDALALLGQMPFWAFLKTSLSSDAGGAQGSAYPRAHVRSLLYEDVR